MTEERKRELAELLEEAMESLVIRYRHSRSSFPVDVYRRYLEEHWTYYRIDFSSLTSSLNFAPDIADGATKSNLLDYIREELALFICRESILKVLNDGKFPDWNNLILGGEDEQASS